ncbi:Uncharacterised protein [Mycobacterium tuberculosis]|nr:Uncharacterised protein [Mycobacterium tuberculosis]
MPYLVIGLVWSSLHGEQVQQIQARLQQLSPASTDIMAFGLAAVLWPAAAEIADACPAR